MERADEQIIVCFNCGGLLYEDDDHIIMTIGGFIICAACEAAAKADIEKLDQVNTLSQ